jgi:hypothetical protein
MRDPSQIFFSVSRTVEKAFIIFHIGSSAVQFSIKSNNNNKGFILASVHTSAHSSSITYWEIIKAIKCWGKWQGKIHPTFCANCMGFFGVFFFWAQVIFVLLLHNFRGSNGARLSLLCYAQSVSSSSSCIVNSYHRISFARVCTSSAFILSRTFIVW